MDGRAILADEVGLGKTIAAGMILKEYLERGLVKKFLILVPASLGFQWTNELVNKIGIKTVFFNRRAGPGTILIIRLLPWIWPKEKNMPVI